MGLSSDQLLVKTAFLPRKTKSLTSGTEAVALSHQRNEPLRLTQPFADPKDEKLHPQGNNGQSSKKKTTKGTHNITRMTSKKPGGGSEDPCPHLTKILRNIQ